MVAWGLWWEGDAEKQLPPFRMFRTDDCGTKKTRKRLSDWKVIMDKLKQLSGFTGHSPASPIIVDQLFQIGVTKLLEVVPKNKNRVRPHDWKIPTAVKLMRAPAAANAKKRKIAETLLTVGTLLS